VEAVRSIEVSTGNLPAEYGKGSVGTLALKTETGDNKLRYSASNFLPTVENHKGWMIGGWTPHFNLSGPLGKNRAWFSDSFDSQYNQEVVEGLLQGKDRMASWRFSNLLRNQINLSAGSFESAGWGRSSPAERFCRGKR
jgi:hypothetical protein